MTFMYGPFNERLRRSLNGVGVIDECLIENASGVLQVIQIEHLDTAVVPDDREWIRGVGLEELV